MVIADNEAGSVEKCVQKLGGKKIKEVLQKRFGFNEIKNVQKGVVWEVSSQKAHTKKDVDLILNSHIFANPISQECHEY